MKYCGNCGSQLTVPVAPFNPPFMPMYPSPRLQGVRIGHVIGGGLIAAIFFGLFFWATTYTWTERVWHEIYMEFGYYETVTHTIDPAIQALFLIVAIVGLIAMVFGIVSRK